MNTKAMIISISTIFASVGLSLASVLLLPKTQEPQVLDLPSKPQAQVGSDSRTALPNFVGAAESSLNAVVNVKTEVRVKTAFYDDYFDLLNALFNGPKTRMAMAFGSGVIISPDGYIVTNNHVVQNAETVEITLNNRKVYQAKVVGTDPSSDLALLKIQASGLECLSFANSDNVRVGEWVLAVGNPFNLNSTVTAGIVSAKARNINIISPNMSGERPIESFIQTDAAVNSGNSGGALVNTNGFLVGINTAIASSNGAFSGYSFAIPANIAKKVTEDLRSFGSVQRAYLGIAFAEMDAQRAHEEKSQSVDGLFIGRVAPKSAAEKAGLQSRDVLLKIDDKKVDTEAELSEILGQHRPGEKIQIHYRRNGNMHSATTTLQNAEGETPQLEIKAWK